MTNTFHQLLCHFVWSTKDRLPLILTPMQKRLYEYLVGTFRSLRCYPYQIGGMPDHIHALVAVPPNIAISELLRNVKVSSSKWMMQTFRHQRVFAWQNGYGAFSVSPSGKDGVIKYIQEQEVHHLRYNFREEFLRILEEQGVAFEEKYLWK